jgi:hypothetical protein
MKMSSNDIIYILGDDYKLDDIVRFDFDAKDKALDRVDFGKAEEIATVLTIPDDTPETVEEFNPEFPPSADDFTIVVDQIKHLACWVAKLDLTYVVRETERPSRPRPLPLWYPSGCAVLMQTSALKFVFVGKEHFTFEIQPKDEVVEFRVAMHSPELLEPCSWIRGKKNTYLLNLKRYVPNSVIGKANLPNPYAWAADPELSEEARAAFHDIRNLVTFL